MKHIKIALLGAAMLAGFSTASMAADAGVPADTYEAMGWYLRSDMGWSWMDHGKDESGGLVIGGGVGYQYNDYIRGDLRADWAGLGDNDQSMTTILGNMYLDIPTETMFTPYVGAGLGYGWATRDNGKDHDGFAYSLMAGTEIGLTDNLSADVGYRFRQILDGPDPNDHQVLVGLRYKF